MKRAMTSEAFKGLFNSHFDLAKRAIELARFYIRAGREVTIDSILDEVRRNPHEDYLAELEALEKEEAEIAVHETTPETTGTPPAV